MTTADLNCKVIDFGSEEQRASISLRRDVLRTPLGLDFTKEELESESDQVHIACFHGNTLTGILLFVKSGSDVLKMRQVAVDEKLQDSGVGRAMVLFAEKWANDNGYHHILLNARETAVPFYLKLGYERIGDMFSEVGIPHYRMTKNI